MATTKTSAWLPWIVATAMLSGCFEDIEDEPATHDRDEPSDDECSFSFENAIVDGGGIDVFYMYVASSSSSEWGSDLLGANILPYGEIAVVHVPLGTWSTRVVDEDGYGYSRYGIDCDGDDWYWRITVGDVD
jgi:hypothetical protein